MVRVLSASIIFVALVFGCARALRGPYAYRDDSDTIRVGGDFIEMVTYPTGNKISDVLKPPTLLSPPNHSVFSHFPRELVYKWKPAEGTPSNAQYLFQYDFTCGNDEQFGDWSKVPVTSFAYRTGKTTLNDRFVGAQPGRWRVKVIDNTKESEWSEWQYFRFTK